MVICNWVSKFSECIRGVSYPTCLSVPRRSILLDNQNVPRIADLGMGRVLHTRGNSTTTGPYSSAMKLFMPYDVHQAMEDEGSSREPTLRPCFATTFIHVAWGYFLLLPTPDCKVKSVEVRKPYKFICEPKYHVGC